MARQQINPSQRKSGFKMMQHSFPYGVAVRTIDGVGFKPKAVIIDGMISTSTSQSRQSKGVAAWDGTDISQGSHATFTQGNSGSVVHQSKNDDTAAFLSINSSGGTTFRGEIISFDDDGITVDVTVGGSFSLDTVYNILFIG